ncbi:MAG: CCA tRNA nucleotidyltransferase, partial [Candidatus Acidiferrales bacterium]
LVANHLRFKDVTHMKPSTLKRFVRLPRFEEHLELHRLDCLSSHRNLEAYHFVQKFLAETPPEQVRPPRLLTGGDLIALGFKPGPLFKEILEKIEDAQLNGKIDSREAASKLAEELYRGNPNQS